MRPLQKLFGLNARTIRRKPLVMNQQVLVRVAPFAVEVLVVAEVVDPGCAAVPVLVRVPALAQ